MDYIYMIMILLTVQFYMYIRPLVAKEPFERTEFNMNEIKTYFSEFDSFFGVKYTNKDIAFKVFEDNIKRISVMNKFTNTATFGINEFTSLTIDEFTEQYTGFNDTGIDNSNVIEFPFVGMANPPNFVSGKLLGLTTFPKRHFNCKISYVYSALSSIEAQCAIQLAYHPHLSDQQGFDCEEKGSCKYGGMPHLVMETLMKQGGVAEDEYYLFGPPSDEKPKNCSLDPQYFIIRVTGVYRMNVKHEEGLVTAFMNYGTIVTAIYVSESVKNYRSGILDPYDCDHKPNHAVVIVGFGTDTTTQTPYWILFNSWGINWGEEGYIRLIRGKRACNIGTYVVTSTVDTIHPHNVKTDSPAIPPETTTNPNLPFFLKTRYANNKPESSTSSENSIQESPKNNKSEPASEVKDEGSKVSVRSERLKSKIESSSEEEQESGRSSDEIESRVTKGYRSF